MKLSQKNLKIMKWVARILAAIVILFGLPFYFGYGNPLPFTKSMYTLGENIWLIAFPLMFIGLGLGWKYEKIGGYLVTIPLVIGLLFGLIVKKELIWFMLFPLLSGILYLVRGYKKLDNKKNI